MEKFNTTPPPVTSLFTIGLVRVMLGLSIFLFVYYQIRLPALVSFLLLSAIEISYYWSRYGLRHLYLTPRLKPSHLFPDETLEFSLRLQNAKWLPVFIEWKQYLPTGIQLLLDNKAALSGKGILKWYETTELKFKFMAKHRGYYELPSPQIYSKDGFGLFSNHQNALSERLEIIVYPRLVTLPVLGLNPSDLIGSKPHQRPSHPDPINVIGLREYTPDMPARLIHWKASAQKDSLLARVQEATSDLRLCVAIDVNAFLSGEEEDRSGRIDDFERALSIAASLVCWADERGIPFGLIANGTQKGTSNEAIIPIGSDPHQGSQVLECLARLELNSNHFLIALLEQTPFSGGTTLVVLGNEIAIPKPPGIYSLVNYSCIEH